MGLADDLDGLEPHQNQARPPAGWEPGFVLDHDAGRGTFSGVSLTESIDPDESRILAEMGLDATNWQVIPGTLQVRKWQQKAGADEWCWYYRISVERRSRGVDVDELVAHVRKHRPRKRPLERPGTQVWATSDWQVGKRGTHAVVDRMLTLPDRFEQSWRTSGSPGHVVVVFGGDLGEGCQHSYPGMTYQIELNERDQRRVVREIAHRVIDRAHKLAHNLTVIAVGGNHGEVRAAKGAIATDPADNRDVAAIEDVRFAWRDRNGTEHIRWMIPDQDLTVCAELGGVRVCVAHGHQFGGIGARKVEQWWDRQSGNRRPAGAADLLISGHYHHTVRHDFGPRTWVQLPAEDAGSPWYAETHGAGDPRPGSVTIDLDGHVGDVRVL